MFPWIRGLSTDERRALASAFGGWALDALDVQMLSFVIPTVITIWGMSRGQAGEIATATLLASALGGWIVGALADRIGRVRLLQLTILWFAFFTFACGFTNSYEQLLAARTLQGLGFGGEWAAGSVLVGEIVQAQHRGKAVGFVQSAWAIGWGAAALLYFGLFSLLPESNAWRWLFWIGLLPAVLVLYIRRNVTEPALFHETRRAVATQGGGEFWRIFAPDVLWTTIRCSLLAAGAQGGYYAITTWLPTYLKSVRNLSILGTTQYLAVIVIGSFVGYLVSAFLTDTIGRRLNFILFSLCSLATVIVYMLVPVNDRTMLFLGFPLGFFASGIFSGMGSYFTELFPSRVRGSGQGFAYNFGRAIGALFPTLIGYLSASMSLGTAIGVFAGVGYGVVLLAVLTLPETRGRTLAVFG